MILTYYPFIIACLTLLSIASVSILNLILFTKYKKSLAMRFINACSISFVGSISFYLIAISVPLLPVSANYLTLSKYLLFITIVFVVIAITDLIKWRFSHPHARLSPDLIEALSQLEDIVFVIDNELKITPINHFDEFSSILESPKKFRDLSRFLTKHCSNHSSDTSIDLQNRCEFYLPHLNNHYLLCLNPILSKNNIDVGYTGVLSNITELKKQELLYSERNHFLEDANLKLKNSVQISGALAYEKERLEIIEHIQNHLINEIESSLIRLKHLKDDEHNYMASLKSIIVQLRNIYSEVRRSVDKISRKDVYR